jgi:cytidylate kinase
MPIITIARGSLSTTCMLAEKLSAELGCKSLSREAVLDHAKKYGIEETGLANSGLMEKQPPHFWDRNAPQRRQYLIYVKAALMDYVAEGDVIYHGHLAQFLLTDVPKLLRVQALASIAIRVNNLMKDMSMSESEAEAHIRDVDARRREWSRFLYGVNFRDPHNYDIVLNMDKMSIETMVGLIATATERPEFMLDDKSKKIIKDVHLKSIVLAHLAHSPRTRGMELGVECDSAGGTVKIQGMAPVVASEVWQADINDVVSKVPGVSNIEVLF